MDGQPVRLKAGARSRLGVAAVPATQGRMQSGGFERVHAGSTPRERVWGPSHQTPMSGGNSVQYGSISQKERCSSPTSQKPTVTFAKKRS